MLWNISWIPSDTLIQSQSKKWTNFIKTVQFLLQILKEKRAAIWNHSFLSCLMNYWFVLYFWMIVLWCDKHWFESLYKYCISSADYGNRMIHTKIDQKGYNNTKIIMRCHDCVLCVCDGGVYVKQKMEIKIIHPGGW